MASHTSSDCFHCGLPVTDTQEFVLVVDQQERAFCCPSCQAVATMIRDGGLDQFYQYRSAMNHRPQQQAEHFSLYDREDVQKEFVDYHYAQGADIDALQQGQSIECTAYLSLNDITCAACVWLIEKHMLSVSGVVKVNVNASTHQCAIRWNPQLVSLSAIMLSLSSIGYSPQPFARNHQDAQRVAYQRMALMRLAVAAFGMMQVGMVSIGLHAGALQGIDDHWMSILRWVSLLVATPVVLFSAQPLWSSAWKNLKQFHLTMEVPVSLAIILAYVASVWATVMQTGEVYFDSVSMFTFFLLLGRYLEMRARFNNHRKNNDLNRLLPLVARRVSSDDESQTEMVVLAELAIGDVVHVYSGEAIPCDGEVLEGSSYLDEALLTGEAEPVFKQQGSTVIAGTINMEGSLLIKATAVNRQTRLSTIEQLTLFAEQDKPQIQTYANTVARYFVAAVLVVASCVYAFWYFYQPELALWVTLSVLVVTCPCALSLATPTVLTATVAKVRASGLLILKGHVIETLTTISRVVFDKTGTLTHGKPTVVDVNVLDQTLTSEQVLSMAAALESGSSHPIATAFSNYSGRYVATERQVVTGSGVQGMIEIEGQPQYYSLGKPSFIHGVDTDLPSAGQWILLAREVEPIAWIRLSDTLRDSAATTVDALQKQHIHVDILSGDNESVVSQMASTLGGLSYRAGVSPEEKLAYVREQQQRQVILMVGDGINDVPVLAGADISVAMDSASDFARTHADALLLNGDLSVLIKAIHLARRCKMIMRQNITWALCYNLLALPLAAAGFIPPYLAAIGMSLSSLVVVINALRV